MRRLVDPHQMRTWISFLLLIAAAIVIFHIVSEFAIIMGWIGAFISIISPFIWGFMLSYALNIPREYFEELLCRVNHPLVNGFVDKRKRGLSIVLTYAALVTLVTVVLNLIVPRIYESIVDFWDFLPTLFGIIEEFLVELGQYESLPFIDLAAIADSFSFDDVLVNLDFDNVTAALNTIWSFTGFVFRAALAIISSVYFLVEAERIRNFAARVLHALMPGKIYPTFMKYGRTINTYFKRYIFCQVLDAVILGTVMTITMSVMGVGYAFVLGPMLGFANLIPYFGSIVGTIAAIIVILITDGTQMGFVATVVLIIIQQIDANFIFPRLLGGQMKIPPLLVIIGIAVGNAFYGIIGMIFAIPIVTVLRNIVVDVLTFVEAQRIKNGNGEVDGYEKR